MARVRQVLERRGDDERNAAALAVRLGIGTADARLILARSRAVGFGAAMLEHQARCEERARAAGRGPAPGELAEDARTAGRTGEDRAS